MLQESGKDFTLLYPEEWENIPYVTESLKAFPNLKTYTIPAGVHVHVPHLLMPEVRPFTACFDGTELQTVRNYMTAHIPSELRNKTYPKKIYITRTKATYRKVENEQELIDYLSPKGFTVLDFDDLSFWEQVAIMQHVKEFVSIHGAGFSNIIFMPPQGNVVELINAFYAELEYTFPFWKQAHVCGHSYYSVFGEPLQKNSSLITSQNITHSSNFLVNQNITIDIQTLKEIII
jgi:capsular polysaccharide biosynthesis protein